MDGSITIEAACVLPLFVLFGMAVLAPIKWLDTQRQFQTAAECLGENLSLSAYILNVEDSEEETLEDAEVAQQEDIQLGFQYLEKIPFTLGAIGGVPMRIAVKRRKWVGLDGKLTVQSVVGEDSNQEMVYVTPEGERYHRYRDCMYLENVCKAVSVQELEYLRNNDRKIYYSCSQCVRGQNIQDTVYITTWGVRYHNDRSCASMSTYFRKVPLIEVVDMGECSVCAKRND